MEALARVQNGSIIDRQEVGAELFNRFIAYLDTTPKTIETYTKALRQLFNYFSLNGINFNPRAHAGRDGPTKTSISPVSGQGGVPVGSFQSPGACG